MKIKGNFIQASNGEWHNLISIRSFYIGGDESVGFRICFNYEYGTESSMRKKFVFSIGSYTIGETRKTVEECQKELDEMMENL